MAAESGFADPDDEDAPLRPAWEDTPDETDADRPASRAHRARPRPAAAAVPRLAPRRRAPALLGPLCAATDALARLDARAAAAPDAVRDGLHRPHGLRRGGRLARPRACLGAPARPRAARRSASPASTALAAVGRRAPRAAADLRRPVRAAATGPTPPFDRLADGDRAVAEALALARLLRRLPGAPADRFATRGRSGRARSARSAAGALDADASPPGGRAHAPRRRVSAADPAAGRGGGRPPLPPLLRAARRPHAGWRPASPSRRRPRTPLLAATGLVAARRRSPRRVRAGLGGLSGGRLRRSRPRCRALRSDAADRLVGRRPAGHLAARFPAPGGRERPAGAARTRPAAQAAAEQGRGLTPRLDQRSRLPDALEALLRTPVLTPKALAAKLGVAPQTATALLRELQAKRLVREVTGGEFSRVRDLNGAGRLPQRASQSATMVRRWRAITR